MKRFSQLLLLSLLVLLLAAGNKAEAKIFNFGAENFAPYIRGDFLQSSLEQTPFAQSSGTGNSFDGKYGYVPTYEFGFLYSFQNVALKFGFGVIRPATLKDISATNSGGTELFQVDNEVSGYIPKVGLDFILKQWGQSRIFMGGEFGLANMTIQNSYAFTAAGLAAYSGMSNFREEVSGSGFMQEYYLGYDWVAMDSTSIVFMGGFRTLKVNSFSHKLDVTSFQGAVTKGAEAKDDTGGARSMDLSGYFASIAFRFWLF